MRFVVLLLLAISGSAWAEPAGPRDTIEEAVTRMVARIEAERQRLEAEPNYAREVVREELDGLVDFRRITRLVMADHFNRASKDQKYAFLDVFKASLINTYASGITLYEGQEIKVLPMAPGDIKGDRARVRTEVQANDGRVVPVFFSLYRNAGQGWQVENVIVNGLNLGKTFRAQFEQSAQQYAGDLDQVIANWSAELDVEGSVAPAESATPSPDGA